MDRVKMTEFLAAMQTRPICYVERDRQSLVVSGSDARTWLGGLVTCDLGTLAAERAVYGLALTQKGRILADLVIAEEARGLRLSAPVSTLADLEKDFETHIIMEDVTIERDAALLVTFLGGSRLDEIEAIASRLRAGENMAHRLDRWGESALVSFVDDEQALQEMLGSTVERAEESFIEALRIERGVPKFGQDFDRATYPQEAGLEKTAVSFSKGCYLGQEVVCMLQLRGQVRRKLVRIDLEGDPPAAGGEVQLEAGEAVGTVTSSAPRLHHAGARALAMLKVSATEPGTKLRVGGAAGAVSSENT